MAFGRMRANASTTSGVGYRTQASASLQSGTIDLSWRSTQAVLALRTGASCLGGATRIEPVARPSFGELITPDRWRSLRSPTRAAFRSVVGPGLRVPVLTT